MTQTLFAFESGEDVVIPDLEFIHRKAGLEAISYSFVSEKRGDFGNKTFSSPL
jgi:hypothetical protein